MEKDNGIKYDSSAIQVLEGLEAVRKLVVEDYII